MDIGSENFDWKFYYLAWFKEIFTLFTAKNGKYLLIKQKLFYIERNKWHFMLLKDNKTIVSQNEKMILSAAGFWIFIPELQR